MGLMQIPALREFEASGRPIWGTCAGLIFLANNVIGMLKGLVNVLDNCTNQFIFDVS
jgi:glutamine amidotransferase PdxT